jgi:hypothetical protein
MDSGSGALLERKEMRDVDTQRFCPYFWSGFVNQRESSTSRCGGATIKASQQICLVRYGQQCVGDDNQLKTVLSKLYHFQLLDSARLKHRWKDPLSPDVRAKNKRFRLLLTEGHG